MNYKSTRDSKVCVTSAKAIAQGISEDGGLFVPYSIPTLSKEDVESIANMNYVDAARFVLGKYLTDFTEEELKHCAEGAYLGTFDDNKPAPLKEVEKGVYSLELWHGPTCAFKDLALQILPFLLTKASKKTSDGEVKVILVATSGDTGKAALEGFSDVEGTKIFTFYPENGVSNMQKLQMITTKGENVGVCAIKGNFDDAQTGVKKIFTNDEMKKKLGDNKLAFSSANSINWGRLAPQIVYYVYSYASLLKEGTIKYGDKVNFVVPTGNFGNILAAYYAKKMGIPVNKLICASNKNNILTDFLTTGEYNRNRPFFTTLSPSMDILISSNLERLLFDLTDGDDRVKGWMKELSDNGVYTIDEETKTKLGEHFCAGCCDDIETKETIKKVFDKFGYLADPHTAVALNVYEKYVEKTGDNTVSVIASTANPYKFCRGVLEAVTGGDVTETDEFVIADTLSNATNTTVPAQIKELKAADIRFTNSVEKEDMPNTVLKFLGIN